MFFPLFFSSSIPFKNILSLLLYCRCLPPPLIVCVFSSSISLILCLYISCLLCLSLFFFSCGFLQSAGMKNLLAQDSTLCIGQSSNAFISYALPGKGSQNIQKASSMIVFSCQQLFNELPLWNFSLWRDRRF